MKLSQRRTISTVLTATLVAASALLVAGPVNAAVLDPANEINAGAYTFLNEPTEHSGYAEDLGAPLYMAGPGSSRIDAGCPEGYRSASRTFIVAPDGTETEVSETTRLPAQPMVHGLDGAPIALDAMSTAYFFALTEENAPSGVNQFVITCEASVPAPGAPIGSAKYFVSYLDIDHTAETWKFVAKPGGGPEKVATSTTLDATGTSATSTTLTATIDKPEATGTVTFTRDGVQVGQATVTAGSASLAVPNLAPATAYSFTAVYSGDQTHEASTSPALPVTTLPGQPGGQPGDGEETEIIVDVPEPGGQGGLTISTAPDSVELDGGLRQAGQDWTATGTLGTVTVIDDRRNASAGAWSLSGVASSFTNGTNSFPASTFGWKPSGLTGAGQPGAETGDLSSAKPLATGAASAATEVKTSVKADLKLTVPSGTPSGDYTSTLTLTLI